MWQDTGFSENDEKGGKKLRALAVAADAADGAAALKV